nr:hypothetical protein [Tanacetum cinerariifolium]
MGDLPPITASTFTTRSYHETPPTNRASTSANPDPVISHTFVKNFKALESLKRKGKRQARNDGVGAELKYSSKERKGTGRAEYEDGKWENRGSKLTSLARSHVGRNANGQPRYSSLTFGYGGTQPSINEGENPHPDGMYPPKNIESSPPNYVNPYASPSNNLSYNPPPNYQQPPTGGYPLYQSYPSYTPSVPMNSYNQHSVGPMYAWTIPNSSYPHDKQPATPYQMFDLSPCKNRMAITFYTQSLQAL